MTLDEARKIAEIAATADGGCHGCVSALVEQLQEDFPEFVWTHNPNGNSRDSYGREDKPPRAVTVDPRL